MSFEPITVEMTVAENEQQFEMQLAEAIDVTIVQGTDVSDTTAVESDVKTGKVFHKANGDRAVGTLSESSEAPLKDVNFFDYDGTCLYSYTASEFADLSALPANPTHQGLTAQGWNWNLADAKTYVAAYGKLNIGQMYVTASGDTELDIELHTPRLTPYLSIAVNGTVEVDWGDGTVKSTVTGTNLSIQILTPHAYAADGTYTIKIHVVSGSFAPFGNSTYRILGGGFSSENKNRVYTNAVQRVRIGIGVTSIGLNAFSDCYSLTSVTIPNSVTSVGINAFSSCYSLSSVTIPNSVTSIGVSAFYSCISLTSATIPSSVTSIGTAVFYDCYSLTSITIPSRVTSIGDNVFNNCNSMISVTIPSSVTSIGNNAFYSCRSLPSVTIPSSVTSIGVSAFYNCYSLPSVTIPSNVTSIGNNEFYNCRSLTSVEIPSNVTSIGSSAFYNCYSLPSVTILSNVTSIGANAFESCYGLGSIHFKPTTPPTVLNSNAWTYLPTDCKIYVPTGKLSAYTGATNYPDSSTYTYVEE